MITIDPYYDTGMYLKAIEALEFNHVEYREYIDIRSKLWYIDIPSAATLKCDKLTNDRYLVEKIRPLVVTEKPGITRKPGDTSLERYLNNDCIHEFKAAGRSGVFAFICNENDAMNLSTMTNHKIYWYGMYSVGLGICVCQDQPPLAYRTIMVPVLTGMFDVEIRKQLLNYRWYLRKYTKQPYFKNGRFFGFPGTRPRDY